MKHHSNGRGDKDSPEGLFVMTKEFYIQQSLSLVIQFTVTQTLSIWEIPSFLLCSICIYYYISDCNMSIHSSLIFVWLLDGVTDLCEMHDRFKAPFLCIQLIWCFCGGCLKLWGKGRTAANGRHVRVANGRQKCHKNTCLQQQRRKNTLMDCAWVGDREGKMQNKMRL